MIDVLKTVMSAVATKDMVQVLTHFCIYQDLLQPDRRIQGGNGIVYIDAPFPHDIPDCTVAASRFLKAVEACDSQPTFGLTEGGKLSIKRNRFRAYLPMLPVADFPRAALTGDEVPLPPNFLDTIRRLKPFISEDASRIWSMSVLLSEGYAYATNNIILVRCPLDWKGRSMALPIQVVDRLLEVDRQPTGCRVGPSHICFSYDDVWMRSQLVETPWPTVTSIIQEPAQEPVPDELKQAVEKIQHFCVNDKFPIIKLSDIVETDQGEQGAAYDGFDLPKAVFHADQLIKALSIATHINFSSYPNPCALRGPDIEGVIVGIRTA